MAGNGEIVFRNVGNEEIITGLAKNIGGNGMLFVSDGEISVGSLLEIQVRPGNPSIPALDAVVEVVRINSVDDRDRAKVAESASSYEVGAVIVSMK